MSDKVEYKNQLLAAQRRRKQAAEDAQLLANRIKLLKQEEIKAWKKIQKTKEKAEEILKLRHENDLRASQRSQMLSNQDADTENARQSKMGDSKLIRSRHVANVQAIADQKRADVLELKSERKRLQQEKEAQKKTHERECAQARQAVLRQKEEARKKMADMKFDQIRKNRMEYEARIRGEEADTVAKELQVQQMEKIEADLIQKLRNTQILQKQAYDELESALSSS